MSSQTVGMKRFIESILQEVATVKVIGTRIVDANTPTRWHKLSSRWWRDVAGNVTWI